MKKITVILLILALVLTLVACGSDPLKNTVSTEETTADSADQVDIASYPKTFDGMQKYLIDLKLLPDKESSKSEVFASIIGADKGVRYLLNQTAFMEFYEFKTPLSASSTPDEAAQLYADIKDDGTFSIAEMDPLTAVISDSGKYVAVYNAKQSYKDYDKILEEFKKW